MAGSKKDPPDKLDRTHYKLHTGRLVKTVICIICESAYYKSDLEKIKNVKYVGKHLIICPDHILRDITSKSAEEYVLSDVAKSVIAQIKLKQSEEIREEFLRELHNQTVEKLNSTVSDQESEIELLIQKN